MERKIRSTISACRSELRVVGRIHDLELDWVNEPCWVVGIHIIDIVVHRRHPPCYTPETRHVTFVTEVIERVEATVEVVQKSHLSWA